jgi:hypothetical protein
MFFHGFHSPVFILALHRDLGLADRQPVSVNDGKAVERSLPGMHWHGVSDPFRAQPLRGW